MIIIILWQHFYSKSLWSYAYNLSRLYVIIVVLRQHLCLTLSWSYAYYLTFYNDRRPLTTFNLTHHDCLLATLARKRNEELTTRVLNHSINYCLVPRLDIRKQSMLVSQDIFQHLLAICILLYLGYIHQCPSR